MTIYNQQISDYISGLFAPEDQALRRVKTETPKKGLPAIQITAEEGRFLQFLVRACGAKLAVELGTLGGYSSIWITRGLPIGGRLITVEKDAHHAEVAIDHFACAGLSERVEVRIGDAFKLLPALSDEGPFGFVFIDADKPSNLTYFNWAVENTCIGGVIAVHNAFRYGKIASPSEYDDNTHTMHAVHQRAASDLSLISTIYPGGDGLLIAVKIS